jgi:UDP:flavonoid glycosyltransferase YjiC (YdhE family)
VVVPLAKLSAARVRAAVETVLDDPSYRQQADRLQRAIRETKGLELAADIIDRELRRHVR